MSVSVLNAQTVVKGRILDARTNSPMPYCTIYFAGKKIGTKSDNFGNFVLKSPKSESVFYVSYLGYETKEVSIVGSEFKTDVIIKEKAKLAKAVEIKGKKKMAKDTLAVRIIRNVIKNRDLNKPSAFKSIIFDKYTKFEVDLANIDSVMGKSFVTKPLKYMLDYQNQTPDGERYSPVLLRETSAKVYQKGTKSKTEIYGVQDTKLFDNESIYALVSYAFEEYSIYDNQLIIANKSMAGPAATSALLFYRYYVDDSFVENGKKNYNMTFAPISKEDFGFTGKLVVEEGSWAIKDAQLYLDKRANINFINHFAISQSFKQVGDKWMRYKDEKDIALSISRSTKKFVKVRFRQVDILTNPVVDQELSDDYFVGDETIYIKGYRKTNDSFWESKRLEKLSAFEEGFYKRSDTFRRSKQYKTLKYFARVGTTAFFPVPPINWELGRAYKILSWNEYEGARWRFGGRITYDSFKRFNVAAHVAYGMKDEKLKYGIETMFNLPSNNNLFHQITASVLHDYQRLGDAEALLDFDNIVLSIFRKRGNFIKDIIFKDQVKFLWTKEWKRGEETALGIDKTTFHTNSFYNFEEIMSDGTIVPRDNINSFKIIANYRYAIKEPVFKNNFKRIRLKSIRPVFEVQSAIGLKNVLESDYSYFRIRGTAKQNVPHILGQFRYNLTAGKVFGRVPYIDIEQLAGNQSFIRDNNRFFLMNEAEYSTDMFAQLFLSQHFQGYIFNKVPLLKKLGWRENVYLRTALGSISDQNKNYYVVPKQMSAPEGLYLETGFGISNIFKFLEVDFMWRATQHDKPNTRQFGILLGGFLEI